MTKKTCQNSRDDARRQLIKSLGITSGIAATSVLIPKTWIKPVVESVILPAHAQTSSLASFLVTGACPSSGVFDDQYHTISFTPDPVTTGAVVTIVSNGSTDPGTPSGATIVAFARHIVGFLGLIFRYSPGNELSMVPGLACINPPSVSINTGSFLFGGGAVTFTITTGGSTGAPTLQISAFNVLQSRASADYMIQEAQAINERLERENINESLSDLSVDYLWEIVSNRLLRPDSTHILLV